MKTKILHSWFDAYNRRHWSSISGLYADDAIIHSQQGTLTGGESITDIAKLWSEALPDAHITPLSATEEEDGLIVVHWKVEGTFHQPLRDIPATGKKVRIHGHTCFRCEGDKIVEHWASVDYRPLTHSVEQAQALA